MRIFLYYVPRVLSLLLIVFISIFALDVFDGSSWVVPFFMHLIPSFILAAVTIIAWKYEKIGGFLFMFLATAFLFFTHFQGWMVSAPAFVIGVLFLASGK